MNHLKPQSESILLLGHGSRDPVAVREFLDFALEFQMQKNWQGSYPEIVSAFLELSEPTIPQALRNLAQKGCRRIVAVPYFLFKAGHVKTEIPEMLEEFRQQRPEIELVYGKSLWPHSNLVELARERIQELIQTFPEPVRKETDVLVVGRGATDPEAIGQFNEAVSELREKIECRNVKSCFIALAEPRFTPALTEMLGNGTRHLVIFPFYLFTGILVKRIEDQTASAKKMFGEARIKIAPYFGAHPLMFRMLHERIEEARKWQHNVPRAS